MSFLLYFMSSSNSPFPPTNLALLTISIPLQIPPNSSPFPSLPSHSHSNPTPKMTGDRKYRRSPKAPLLSPKHHHRHCNHDPPFDLPEVGFSGASFSGAVFNLSTTIVGAGIMALPATFKQLGLVPGVTLIILAAVLTNVSIDMILRFSKSSKCSTYAGLAGDSFGGFGRNVLQVCIVVNNLGMLVVYLIIIGDVLAGTWMEGVHHRGLMEEWVGDHWWTSRSSLLFLTTLFVIAPLICFKRVDSLRYTSALSVGLAVVFVAIIAGVAIVKLLEGTIEIPPLFPQVVDQASFWKLFTTIPILVTAYICHHNVHPIENELKDPSQMKSIVKTSLLLCSFVYVATSFFGFLLFGEETLDDVLSNFDGDLGVSFSLLLDDVIRVSYGVHLMLVFPIVFFSLRLNVDGLLFPYALPISYDNKRFYSLTGFLMAFIFLGANFVPSIWDAFQFTGATATISVGYIFPALIALRDNHSIATKKDRLISWLMILLAVSSSTVAILSDMYSFFVSKNGHKG